MPTELIKLFCYKLISIFLIKFKNSELNLKYKARINLLLFINIFLDL